MTVQKPLIRFLVLIATISYLLWVFYRVLFAESIDPVVWEVIKYDGAGSQIPNVQLVYVVFILLTLTAYAGIFFLKAWGFFILIAIYLSTFVLLPFSGIQVYSPVERTSYALLLLCDGALLGIWISRFMRQSEDADTSGSGH